MPLNPLKGPKVTFTVSPTTYGILSSSPVSCSSSTVPSIRFTSDCLRGTGFRSRLKSLSHSEYCAGDERPHQPKQPPLKRSQEDNFFPSQFFYHCEPGNFFSRNQYLRYIFTKVAVLKISFKIFLYLSFFTANST